jgi:hypothetical protein
MIAFRLFTTTLLISKKTILSYWWGLGQRMSRSGTVGTSLGIALGMSLGMSLG